MLWTQLYIAIYIKNNDSYFMKKISKTRLEFVCMKYILLTPFISLIILLSSCNRQIKDDSEGSSSPYTIDFKQCMDTEQVMKVSEIADTVEYLELKTPKDIIITRIMDIIPVDDELIIYSRDGLYKFTKKGEYIKTIGRSGQGPGEYSWIRSIAVDLSKKEIIIADGGQVLFYDLDGNFLRSGKWGSFFRIGISDSILWVSELAHRTIKHIAFAVNSKGDTIASMLNPQYGMKSLDEGMGVSFSRYSKMFYSYKGSLYLKGKEQNDTIFQLSGKNRIPYAFLDMGKYKLPIEYEAWYSNDAFLKHGSRYWGIPAVAEDDRYLYLLSQRYSSIDGDNYGHNEENFRYIVYNKEKRNGFVAKDKKGTKITDDILGGPPVWPHWITDDYYMNVIEWSDLSDELKKGKYTLAPSLEKQFAGFGYSTNQLIVLCRRKK